MYSIESNLILYPKIDEEYRCQAEHPGLSKPLRAMAMINIYRQPFPPVIDGYKNGDIINYQEKLTLKCTSINGYPPPTIIWYRNGVEIDRQSTIIQQNGRHEVYNTLTIIVDHNDNQAQYTCQVMNSLTTIPLQETITLNVFCKFYFFKKKRKKKIILFKQCFIHTPTHINSISNKNSYRWSNRGIIIG